MVNCKLYFNLAQIDLFHVPKDLLDFQGELFDKLLKLVLFESLNKDEWDKRLYGKFMLCLKKTLMCYVYQFGKPGNLLLTQKEYLSELLLKIVQVYYQNPILFEELDDNFILYDVIVQQIKTDEKYHRALLFLLCSSNISKSFSLWLEKSDIDTVYLHDIFITDFKPRIKYFVKALRACCDIVQNRMYFRFQQMFKKFILSNGINKFEYSIFIFQELNEFSTGLVSREFQAYLNQLSSPMFLELLTCCLDSSANCDILFGTTVNTIERRTKDQFRQRAQILSKNDFVIKEIASMLKISTNSNGFNQTSTTNIYFQLLLNFFANNSNVNEKLEDLTIKLLISTTVLGSPEFNIIIDFLFKAYSNYQEITRIDYMVYLGPPIEVLERLNVSIKYPTRIQFSLLFENMIIFSRMLIKTYCVCTLRFILQ